MTTSGQRTRAQELHAKLTVETYERSVKEGMNLSAWLEKEDPSAGYNDGLDAFERQLMVADIRTNSIPEKGIVADRLEKFRETEAGTILLMEWAARQWRQASYAKRGILESNDAAVGTSFRPYIDSAIDHSKKIAPAIPISEVVAMTTSIDGDTYRSSYLVDVAADQRWVRVAEGTPIPATKIVLNERSINLYKFGRTLISTYEAMRRWRIDRVGRMIARMAVQAEVDKLAAIIDVLVNGDGNSGTAATNVLAKTDLDANATGKTVTMKAWLLFKMKFLNPYMLTTVLAKSGDAYKLLTLNTGSANIPLVTIAAANGFGGFRQINAGLADNVALGWTDDAPTDTLVALDNRFAIERVVEIGASITEVQKWARSQKEELVMSEVEGYAKADPYASYTLTLET